jgi:hypothetical protein
MNTREVVGGVKLNSGGTFFPEMCVTNALDHLPEPVGSLEGYLLLKKYFS